MQGLGALQRHQHPRCKNPGSATVKNAIRNSKLEVECTRQRGRTAKGSESENRIRIHRFLTKLHRKTSCVFFMAHSLVSPPSGRYLVLFCFSCYQSLCSLCFLVAPVQTQLVFAAGARVRVESRRDSDAAAAHDTFRELEREGLRRIVL